MADNYLERKMEELRSGRLNASYRNSAKTYRRPGMYFAFPPRRVVISSENSRREEIARKFRMTESKVKVSDCVAPEEFNQLLIAWRDVDILVADAPQAALLIQIWQSHRRKYPYIFDYVSRIIILTDKEPIDFEELEISGIRATINQIVCRNPEKEISDLVATLTIPANDVITQKVFLL